MLLAVRSVAVRWQCRWSVRWLWAGSALLCKSRQPAFAHSDRAAGCAAHLHSRAIVTYIHIKSHYLLISRIFILNHTICASVVVGTLASTMVGGAGQCRTVCLLSLLGLPRKGAALY